LQHWKTKEIEMRISENSPKNSSVKTGLWLILLTTASVLTTFALACATPVAAFAALAALHMKRAEAMLLMGVVWLASQCVGFGYLHYPYTAGTIAWGGALLISALVTMEGAAFVTRRMASAPDAVRAAGALGAAMVVFKAAIYLFGMELGGNASAFKLSVVTNFVWTNALTFVVLLVLYQVGVAVGLVARSSGPQALTA
jgi:hypothetical protein